MDKNEVKAAAKWLAVATVGAMLKTLRFALYAMLLMASGVLEKLLKFFIGVSIFCLIALAIMGRIELEFWAFLGFGFGSMVLLLGYQALLSALAPDDSIIVHEI